MREHGWSFLAAFGCPPQPRVFARVFGGRVEGAGEPTIAPFMAACSVVVAGAANVAVMERSLAERVLPDDLVEPALQDRRDGAVGGRTDVVAAPACRLDALRPVALDETDDAET